MMDEVKYRLIGIGPQLMKSGRMANRLDPMARKVAEYTKRAKNLSEEETFEKYRFEWEGSLYLNPESGVPGWPADNILACLTAGAKRFKLGKKVGQAVWETKPFFDLIYEGPKDVDGLWADGRFVDIRTANGNPSAAKKTAVQRARPIFRNWQLEVSFAVDTREISLDDVEKSLRDAGTYVGLSDWRPRFGRFALEAL